MLSEGRGMSQRSGSGAHAIHSGMARSAALGQAALGGRLPVRSSARNKAGVQLGIDGAALMRRSRSSIACGCVER